MKHSEKEQRIKRRARYYLMQKLLGVACLLITAVAVKMLDGDATIALFMVPLGVVLITTKEMLIVNQFYRETRSKRKVEGKNL